MGKRHNSNENPELFQILLNEYAEIRVNPEKELSKTGRSELYTDLTKLIVKISDYIFCEEDDIWKGYGSLFNVRNTARNAHHYAWVTDCS